MTQLSPNKVASTYLFKSLRDMYRTRNMQLGLPIERLNHIPYGYTQHPSLSKVLYMKEDMWQALCDAKTHLQSYSYEDVAMWLSELTKTLVSASVLRDLMLHRQPMDEAMWFSLSDRLEVARAMSEKVAEYNIAKTLVRYEDING